MAQENQSLEKYVGLIDEISATISPTDQGPLAAMFITGLTRRKEQDALVKELTGRRLCKVHDNRQVEMKCGWREVKLALERAGLVGGGRRNGKQGDSSAKRRKKA